MRGLIRVVTEVLRKGWAYLRGSMWGLIGGEIRYTGTCRANTVQILRDGLEPIILCFESKLSSL